MKSIKLRKERCDTCPGAFGIGCVVVKCPKCQAVRWLEHWEVYDDFAVCPTNDCVVPMFESMLTIDGPPLSEELLPPSLSYLICHNEVDAEIAAEDAARKKPRRARKPAGEE